MLSLTLTLFACAKTPEIVLDDSATFDSTGSDAGSDDAGAGDAGATDDTGTASDPEDYRVLRGAILAGGEAADVQIAGGRITAVGAPDTLEGEVVDVSGRWLAPAFIDSHVHLAYLDDRDGMLDGGVAAAVDMAAPTTFFVADLSPMTLLMSGPMVTGIGGYPTQSWGANGYGLECADADAAVAAVEELAGLGAGLIKIPRTGSNDLSVSAMEAAVEAAHALGLKVASHATSGDLAAEALSADLLAHTPTGSMSASIVEAWGARAVVSTLDAFGGTSTTVENLRQLREAGATVLYGTDFGNTRNAGIDPEEIALLMEAGLDGAAILAAGTATPADYWGLDTLGAIEPGRDASFLVLSADPIADAMALTKPVQVWIQGEVR